MSSHPSIPELFGSFFAKESLIVSKILFQYLEQGHICVPLDPALLPSELSNIPIESIAELEDVRDLSSYNPKPFIRFNNHLYLHRFFQYENTMVSKINQWLEDSRSTMETRLEQLKKHLPLLKELFGFHFSGPDLQMWAAVKAYLYNFCIITGGPGTGKTTTVAHLLALLLSDNPELRVWIAAPTGKAAARINESFLQFNHPFLDEHLIVKIKQIKAQTIHRLLGGFEKFKYDADNPLPVDLLIVDESSMIDASLMAKLFQAIERGTRLIMLGDKNQLSSVEAGSVFADLCQAGLKEKNAMFGPAKLFLEHAFACQLTDFVSYENELPHIKECIVELTKSRRFRDDMGIGKFSQLVIQGKEQNWKDWSERQSEQYVIVKQPEAKFYENDPDFQELMLSIKDYIEEEDLQISMEKLNRFKLLCVTREGFWGMNNINQIIETQLQVNQRKEEFYHKQPIMITENNLSLGIFNGDIGFITAKLNEHSELIFESHFWIENQIKTFPTLHLQSYETAFAMTIHKSQGSEYEKVFIFLPQKENHPLLCRELLYTAVTRSKKHCFVYGEQSTLDFAVSRKIQRMSGILSRW